MVDMCIYCNMGTNGNHESDCPLFEDRDSMPMPPKEVIYKDDPAIAQSTSAHQSHFTLLYQLDDQEQIIKGLKIQLSAAQERLREASQIIEAFDLQSIKGFKRRKVAIEMVNKWLEKGRQ